MELKVIKNEAIPIKAIPEIKLNQIIIGQDGLSDWLCQLLTIKPTEENVSRLEVLLPMVKENCWSMTISEIKKAFLLYAQGKLPIEPVDNYLTAILFSKVITAYKQQRKPEVELLQAPTMSKEEINENAKENIILAYDHFKQHKQVPSDYAVAFDRLYEWGILPKKDKDDKTKKRYHGYLCQAHVQIVGPVLDELKKMEEKDSKHLTKYAQLKKRKHELNNYNHPEVQSKFRCLVLQGFFSRKSKDELLKLIEV